MPPICVCARWHLVHWVYHSDSSSSKDGSIQLTSRPATGSAAFCKHLKKLWREINFSGPLVLMSVSLTEAVV